MKPFALSFILSLFYCTAHCQDLIIIRSGDTIRAKVVKVLPEKITYKHSEADTETFTLNKEAISYITYKNGTTDTFSRNTTSDVYGPQSVSYRQPERLAERGRQDARLYYKGYRGAKTAITITSIVAGPIYGLIPTFACANALPGEQTLHCPYPELMARNDYEYAYKKEAAQIKRRQVWRGYRNGVIVDGVFLAISLVALFAIFQH